MAEFKDMLVYFRKLHNMSQAELARRVSVAPTTIASYEQGKRHPSFEIEEAIADVFNVNLNTLRGIENKSSALTSKELEFIELYRKATPEVQNLLFEAVKNAAAFPSNPQADVDTDK